MERFSNFTTYSSLVSIELFGTNGDDVLSVNLLCFVGKLHYNSICRFESDLKHVPCEYQEEIENLGKPWKTHHS